MTGPRCLECGGAIRKRTTSHTFSHADTAAPTSKAGCAALTNEQVVHVAYWHTGRVRNFSTWDGATYDDPHFCSDQCARRFGRWAARAGVRRF